MTQDALTMRRRLSTRSSRRQQAGLPATAFPFQQAGAVCLLVVFMAVPVILYNEFRRADQDKQDLLSRERAASTAGSWPRACDPLLEQ